MVKLLYRDSIFNDKPFNSTYTREFKENVVKEYLDGKGSIESLQIKYKILSNSTLRKWILKYNNGIILKDYKPMSEVYTMKSRKVSYEERIEIVNYCIANNYDYKYCHTQLLTHIILDLYILFQGFLCFSIYNMNFYLNLIFHI